MANYNCPSVESPLLTEIYNVIINVLADSASMTLATIKNIKMKTSFKINVPWLISSPIT